MSGALARLRRTEASIGLSVCREPQALRELSETLSIIEGNFSKGAYSADGNGHPLRNPH